MKAENIKREICEAGKRLYERGFVAANDGNISVRISDSEILVTPTGVSKGYMTEDMITLMDLERNILDGGLKPSSEVKMHIALYSNNPDIKAVVHAHAPYSTAYAVAGISLDEADFAEPITILGVIPVTKFALPGTKEAAESVVPFCMEYNGALLSRHGAVTWGGDLKMALHRMEALEHYAKIHTISRYIIGSTSRMGNDEIDGLIQIREKMGIIRGGRPNGN